MTLGRKIFAMIAVVVTLSILGVSASVYLTQRAALGDLIRQNLESERRAAKTGFESYLQSIEKELSLWASLPSTQEALQAFDTAWRALGSAQEEYLQRLYITENPNPAEEKSRLLAARDGSAYSRVHGEYHPYFKRLKNTRGYYDVFLMDAGGNVVYSVYKELDFATNLIDGTYAASGLGAAFRAARDAAGSEAAFVDFAPYAPSYGAPASFIAQKVLAPDGSFLGVLAFQMPIDRLDALVGDLGQGLFAMVVGADGLLRNNDARFGENAILTRRIESDVASAALGGGIATGAEARDGRQYLQSASTMSFLGTTWAFIVEVDRQLALAPLAALRNTVMLVALACLIFAGATALWIGGSIARPIGQLSGTLRRLIDGERDVQVGHQSRRDEIGEIAASVAYFKDRLVEMDDLQRQTAEAAARERRAEQTQREAEAAARDAERQKEERDRIERRDIAAREARIAREISEVVEACAAGDFSRRLDLAGKEGVFAEICRGVNRIGEVADEGLGEISSAMTALAGGDLTFRLSAQSEGTFRRIAQDVNRTIDSLAGAIGTIRESSARSGGLMSEIAASADSLSRRTEANAAALEETSAALTEMEQSVQSALQSAQSARAEVAAVVATAEGGMQKVQQTVSAMEKIQESATEIARIIDLIDGIAFQTNLLALNAGVEAARAGSAGRGFAVVANEVRALAARSAEAAREIAALVSESGTRVEKGVAYSEEGMKVLTAINASVRQVAEKIDGLATASAEQSAAIGSVNASVATLDNSTQQNAAMFQQSTVVTAKMNEEIGALMHAVGAFAIPDDAATPAPGARTSGGYLAA